MSLFVLSQIFIAVAICSDILSFQFKKRERIVACLLVSCTMISIHFVCLGHWTAAGLGVVAAARFTTSLYSTSKVYMALFIGLSVVIAALTYEGLLSILGCSGATISTFASFCKEDKMLRQLMLVSTIIWIFHNYLAGSPGAVLMELLFISSNLVGYFRYYIKPKKQMMTP